MWYGERDMFEDSEYNCLLCKQGSRQLDHQYLVAKMVDRLQGCARLWMKEEDLSNYEHDGGM